MLLKICLIFIQWILFSEALIGEQIFQVEEENLRFIVGIKKFNFGNIIVENDFESTGILISRRDVLTTDRSMQNLLGIRFEIIIGSVDLRSGIVYNPFWWMNYEHWAQYTNRNIEFEVYDVAIIRLLGTAPEDIEPVTIMSVSPGRLYRSEILIAGWGQMENGTYRRHMHAARLRILTKNECLQRLQVLMGRSGSLPDNILCSVANPYVIATPSDGGSPILYSGSLVAIHKSVCPKIIGSHSPNQINIHLLLKDFIIFIYGVLNMI